MDSVFSLWLIDVLGTINHRDTEEAVETLLLIL